MCSWVAGGRSWALGVGVQDIASAKGVLPTSPPLTPFSPPTHSASAWCLPQSNLPTP